MPCNQQYIRHWCSGSCINLSHFLALVWNRWLLLWLWKAAAPIQPFCFTEDYRRFQTWKYWQHFWVHVYTIFICRQLHTCWKDWILCGYPCRNIPLHSHGVCSSSAHVTPTLKLSELSSQNAQCVEITMLGSAWEHQNFTLRYKSPNIYASFNHLSFLVVWDSVFLLILFISSLFFSSWIIGFAQSEDGNVSVFSDTIYLTYSCIISVVFSA